MNLRTYVNTLNKLLEEKEYLKFYEVKHFSNKKTEAVEQTTSVFLNEDLSKIEEVIISKL